MFRRFMFFANAEASSNDLIKIYIPAAGNDFLNVRDEIPAAGDDIPGVGNDIRVGGDDFLSVRNGFRCV